MTKKTPSATPFFPFWQILLQVTFNKEQVYLFLLLKPPLYIINLLKVVLVAQLYYFPRLLVNATPCEGKSFIPASISTI